MSDLSRRIAQVGAVAVLIVWCASIRSAPSAALDTTAGLAQTFGSQNYLGTSAYVRLKKDEYSLKPSYSQFHSDLSGGSFRTISARAAYDVSRCGVGLTVGGTPEVNGYSSAFFGADGVVSAAPDGDGGWLIGGSDGEQTRGGHEGLSRVDLGAEITRTAHHDQLEAVRVRRGAVPGGTVTIGQTDLRVSAGTEFLANWLSLDVTKSVYDRDLNAFSRNAAPVLRLTGLSSVIAGFPDKSVSLRYELDALPVVIPFASYTYTTFELDEPDSHALTGGAYVEIGAGELGASLQHYVQSGQPDQNLVSISGRMKF